jgi:FlaA1/EpsC-like NDP-sugar epimerase
MPLQRPLSRTPSRSFNRILLNMLLDGALAATATPIARYIADPGGGLLHPLWFIAGGAITLLLAGAPFRMPQQYWRFSGIEDLLAVVGGSVASAILFALLLTGAGFPLPTPTFPIIHALVLIVALGAPRVLYRMRPGRARHGADAQPVLLAGAGEGADLFLRALEFRDGRRKFRVVGLLSRNQGQAGRRIHGQPILGSVDQAAAVLARLRADDRLPTAIVLTDPDLSGPSLAALLAQADAEGVPVRHAPRPTALQSTPGASLELAPVMIEDLLNRPQVPLDRDGIARLVRGRRVLVTGAGGTIGSELARQVAAQDPALLVLLDNGEYALWQIDTELSEAHPTLDRQLRIADVRDEARIRAIFDDVRPELVFHAAALKHVPMVEANPAEGLLTNACGTRHVADAARAAGASAMVFISTDKAVNPSSVMGASKRLAEMYVQGIDVAGQKTGGMRCVTVRFGNVLGSTGSVVPLFRRQLEHGGPLTVTHPDMQRYFMTVREAVGLVLQASVVGMAGLALPEAALGGIFVLDMGDPVKIVDLARQMIRLAGLKVVEGDEGDEGDEPGSPGSIRIAFSGLRPGEKLFEELFHGKEAPVPTGHPGLLMAAPRTADPAIVGRAIDEIAALCRAGQADAALGQLSRLVPEYQTDPTGAARALPGV